MHANAPSVTETHRTSVIGERVRATLLFTLVVLTVLAVLWPTTLSMLETWQRSSTYSHCYLVIPIAIWGAWRQSATLVGISPKPLWPGLALIAAIGFVWLIGELASAAVVSQLAAIAMVIAAALTVFGVSWVRRLAFPFGLLLFAVPFGEEMMPLLINWTADVTVWALRATGIPVYREGNDFITPSGNWSIIEACAGVRYLIAALMTGCIFAWLQYRSLAKRAAFVAAALVVALIANWLRAYAIVVIAHVSDHQFDAGIDHNTWGWLIFGAAMFLLFAVGARWADQPQKSAAPSVRADGARAKALHSMIPPVIASLVMIALWPTLAGWFESRVDLRPVQLQPIAPSNGWHDAAHASGGWAPELVAPSAVQVQTFTRDGHAVGVYQGVYRGQRQGADLANHLNQIVASDSKRWRLIRSGTAQARVNDEPVLIETALVRGLGTELLVWHWYWVDGRSTSSDFQVKLQHVRQRLTGASDTAAWNAVYTKVNDDVDAATRTLSAFLDAMSGSIDAALRTTASR